MQPAYPCPVSSTHPRHALRRENLERLFADPAVKGPTNLARLLGKPNLSGHFSNIRNGIRDMGDDLARDVESSTGRPPGWMDRQHSVVGEPTPQWPQAHPASHPVGSHDLPYVPWEAIVGHQIPAVFRSTLPDDALSPDFPAGTEIVWTTRRKAAPGRLILVKDRHGQVHARQCHQGREPGQWLAAPINAAYITFDSNEDGVELLAVYKGRLEPDD